MVEVTDSSSVSTTEKASQKCEAFFLLLHHYNAKSEKKRDFQKQKGSGVTRAIFVDGAPVPE